MARVSVGLPVYNGERYLNEALDSILRQTFEDFELIISDNASSDRTEEICEEYARNDKRIRYSRSSENLGVAWNFNRVAGLSTSEYFRWATADDLWRPKIFRRAWRFSTGSGMRFSAIRKRCSSMRMGNLSGIMRITLIYVRHHPVSAFINILQKWVYAISTTD